MQAEITRILVPCRGSQRIVAAFCALGFIAPSAPPASGADPFASTVPTTETLTSGQRIVHVFDFAESEVGNVESIPKYWEPLRMPGFPLYPHGQLDRSVGFEAPPSFHLASEGRSVAYMYRGPDTRVRANTDYRIAGQVRPDRLRFARSCLAAVYLNDRGEPLLDTLVRTPLLPAGIDDEQHAFDEWIRFGLTLPASPAEAVTIGLVAWVLQEEQWRGTVPDTRHLPFRDVQGGVWLDDITVIALPRVELTTSAQSNVLQPTQAQFVLPLVADQNEGGLSNLLTISDADGRPIEQHVVPTQSGASVAAVPISVEHLPPGVYDARLDVRSQSRSIATRELRFARLAEPLSSGGGARSFGIVVNPAARADADKEVTLLRAQGALAVKLPVWSAHADRMISASGNNDTDRLLHTLERDGFALTGVLYDAPDELTSGDGAARPTLYELLSSSPAGWQDHLSAHAAPFAGTFRSWQLGGDGAAAPVAAQQLHTALDQLREIMRRFVTMPRFVLPVLADAGRPSPPWPVEQLCMNVGANLLREETAEHIAGARRDHELVHVFAPPLDSYSLQRIPRLAEWARRLLAVRHAGTNTTYVPQTWTARESPLGAIAEPLEEFVVLQSLIAQLGDAAPGPPLYLGKGITCMTFHRGEEGILAVWSEAAPPEGRPLLLQVAGADRAVDLWGGSSSLLIGLDGRASIQLSERPLLIPGVQRSLIALQAGVSLDDTRFEAGAARQPATLAIANPEVAGRSGSVRLIAPDQWDITPTQFDFVVPPRSTYTQSISVDIPHNAIAGAREIRAELTLSDGHRIDVLLPIMLGLDGLDVRGLAYLSGDVLHIRQIVFNGTGETVHFRGSALLPGTERQYRPITSLAPGTTQAVQYRFENAAQFAGGKVRLELRELNDGRRTHAIDVAIP